jgi:hypothetical protein
VGHQALFHAFAQEVAGRDCEPQSALLALDHIFSDVLGFQVTSTNE